MLKNLIFVAALALLATASYAATPEEKRAVALQEAKQLVDQYGGSSDPITLQKLDSYIERTWLVYTHYFGTETKLARKFSLLRAKSATAAKRKTGVAESWRQAIRLLPLSTTGQRRLSFYTQAANASTVVKDYKAAEQFFAAARVFTASRGKEADRSKLYLRIQELRTTGEGMEWRRLNDSLLDLRKFSEKFVSWSIPYLDALLGEAEIRLAMQPNKGAEKREDLGALKARIILVQKGMNGAVPPSQVDRIRTLFYALEDHFQL